MVVNRIRNKRAPTIFGMGDKGIRDVLWDNVLGLMRHHYGRENINRMARETKVGVATIQRIKDRETSVGLDVVEKIAKRYKLEPWQLLAHGMSDEKFLDVLALWNQTDGRGRRMLLGAVRGAAHEEDEDSNESVDRTGFRKGQR